MLIRTPKNWEIPESAVTPEDIYRLRNRRDFLKTLGLGAAGALFLRSGAFGATTGFPAAANPDYTGAGLKVTPYPLITSYNNFYEFGTDKGDPAKNAHTLRTRPWTVKFEGLVAKGEIHYYLGENTETFGGGTGSSAITSWVAAHFKSETVGGVTVYNLTEQK